jgi:signal transduction histidine kinase
MQEKQIFEKILTGIDDEIMLISRDYKIIWANKHSIDKYGSDIINKRCYYVTHGLDFPCQGPFDICPLSDVLVTGKSSSATHIHASPHNNGTQHHVSINVYPVTDGNGEITRFVHTAKDVTDSVVHRQMEEQMWQEIIKVIDRIYAELVDNQLKLEKSKEALEQRTTELERSSLELQKTQDRLIRSEKLAAIGQLAASVAHELRNPLGVIKNSAYYLRDQLTQTGMIKHYPNMNEFLSIIENEISLSDKIIRDLLNFSLISKPIMNPEDINAIIEYAVSITTKPENVRIILNLQPDMKRALIDQYQIRQAFYNLILNAYQAMERGGTLEITSREHEGFIEVAFKDSGAGIQEKDREKIFDALFTTKAKGIGLGLAVTHGIIEQHGGQIILESEIGKGSTFTIRVPVVKEEEARLKR